MMVRQQKKQSPALPARRRGSNETRIVGTEAFHGVIGETQCRRFGTPVGAANNCLEAARQEIATLTELWHNKPTKIHVVVTVEPLADAGRNPLSNRLVT